MPTNLILASVVASDITAAYDEVEEILNRISVRSFPELCVKLTDAKNALFEARVIADEASRR